MKKLNLPWEDSNRSTTVVVYKKTKKSRTYYMIVTDIHADVINNGRATKPMIDHKYEIVEIGIGSSFIEKYSAQYKVKKPQIVSKY